MTKNEIATLKRAAEIINEINTLKSELEDILSETENEDFEDSLESYISSVDDAESYVFDTFRAYEDECKFDSLEWIY